MKKNMATTTSGPPKRLFSYGIGKGYFCVRKREKKRKKKHPVRVGIFSVSP